MHRQFRRSAFAILFCVAAVVANCAAHLPIHTNDIIAWVGGSDVASARDSGHFETLMAVRFPGTRFLNFGWEGDTVFAQPRDVNFPPTVDHLKRAKATVILLQFGRAEALAGDASAERFAMAYEQLADRCAATDARLVLMTPAPFENSGSLLPDLTQRNRTLAEHVQSIRLLARAHNWLVLDAFAALSTQSSPSNRLTSDGLNLTPQGHAIFAATVLQLLSEKTSPPLTVDLKSDGSFTDAQLESLRLLVLEKNRLWFNYWRPQNWAFLGGDRTTQPSSRDHRDPKVRWFPAEMERYVPLIERKEREIETAARHLQKGQL